jgi:SAM-dependent methyltransferase
MSKKRRSALANPHVWERGAVIARRLYESYDEYLAHQATKNELPKYLAGFNSGTDRNRAAHERRFAGCEALRGMRAVLCLGARLGCEVAALRNLGHFAVGIDINPVTTANRYVLPGDFHKLDFADGAVDAVYTNALDHAFDLDRVIGEVARVLRAGGVFMLHIVGGSDEGRWPGIYEATWWRDRASMIEHIATVGGFVADQPRALDGDWLEAVFRKPE